MRSLASHGPLTFKTLLSLTDLSWGSLSVHAYKLVEAKYVEARKFFVGRVPRTEFRLTPAGRRALKTYVGTLSVVRRRRATVQTLS